MKRFEIKKKTVVSFDSSAEIPSDLTDNVGGGAITLPRYACNSGIDEPCYTDYQASCDTCNSCDNTCYASCYATCNNTCANTCVATCNNTCNNTCAYTCNGSTRPIRACQNSVDFCHSDFCNPTRYC